MPQPKPKADTTVVQCDFSNFRAQLANDHRSSSGLIQADYDTGLSPISSFVHRVCVDTSDVSKYSLRLQAKGKLSLTQRMTIGRHDLVA